MNPECDDCCHLCGTLIGNEEYHTNAVVKLDETIHVNDFEGDSISFSDLRDHAATTIRTDYAHANCNARLRDDEGAIKTGPQGYTG